MNELLHNLLEKLILIGREHPELYDSEVRERMGEAVMDGFVRKQEDFLLISDFGMRSTEANELVRNAIAQYIALANRKANEIGVQTFHARLAMVQNSDVKTSVQGTDYEEFFGHTPPEFYDESGQVVRQQ